MASLWAHVTGGHELWMNEAYSHVFLPSSLEQIRGRELKILITLYTVLYIIVWHVCVNAKINPTEKSKINNSK